ncbi:hypothetical protein NDU88_001367 [Pleurodeles waltl]|uniref:Uncharacterized protein n=1 Tax=Pleurodeles waltl TaxID=8319 RepID=A0AAV7VXD4_PLEWA|nr:hypothetical protein NDU88_001367 [Pleurodeles waltl]
MDIRVPASLLQYQGHKRMALSGTGPQFRLLETTSLVSCPTRRSGLQAHSGWEAISPAQLAELLYSREPLRLRATSSSRGVRRSPGGVSWSQALLLASRSPQQRVSHTERDPRVQNSAAVVEHPK